MRGLIAVSSFLILTGSAGAAGLLGSKGATAGRARDERHQEASEEQRIADILEGMRRSRVILSP